jgi:hypothetical protein
MNKKLLIFELYPCVCWALFAIGVTELVLVLTNPIYFLIATLMCAILFIIFLVNVLLDKKDIKKSIQLLTICTGLVIFFKCIYNYSVLLLVSDKILIIHIFSVLLFWIAGFICYLIFPRLSDVA